MSAPADIVAAAPETASPEPAEPVARALNAHGGVIGAFLKTLRALVFDVARTTEGVGELDETLKWGQPSYTPKKRGIGSSVRLGVTRDGEPALFFICHTHLVERFREHYGDLLQFEGNRAIVLKDVGETQAGEMPLDALRHCIAMALTYHRRG